MSRIRARSLLRGAGWCLSLLLVAWPASISFVSAGPQPLASSVYAGPVVVLPEFRPPTPTPTATPTPEATPSPAPSPLPTVTSAPRAEREPAPATEVAPEPWAASQPSAPAQVAPAPPPPPPPPPQPYADGPAAAAIVTLTNELRAQHGLSPLTVDGALAASAQAYAETMAANDWFAHVGPDGSTTTSRAQAAGYTGWTYVAENLYRGFYGDSAADVVQAWVASPAHLSAMLSYEAQEIGVGCAVSGADRWCVQTFGAR